MASPDLLTSFYFSVKVTGKSSANDAAFQEASGLGKEIKTEDVGSGGENRFRYRLPAGTTYQNLVLKRGVVLADSPLIEWCQMTLDGGLGKPVETHDVLVSLLNEKGQTCISWTFAKAYPVKWQMSDLKSQESSILVETIEFAYRYFEVDDSRDNEYAGVAALFGDE
ncbi:phage tail protein [Massilia agilis]|uniref:Phage tail protein n=1 Tax=Massilia agilis TaxID=1811226 RepID=A0ABT2DGL8_9BURK|nr:phage tail protein [Massilia agilis]MCS0810463.1 phage tail protein [Massilia agilis]